MCLNVLFPLSPCPCPCFRVCGNMDVWTLCCLVQHPSHEAVDTPFHATAQPRTCVSVSVLTCLILFFSVLPCSVLFCSLVLFDPFHRFVTLVPPPLFHFQLLCWPPRLWARLSSVASRSRSGTSRATSRTPKPSGEALMSTQRYYRLPQDHHHHHLNSPSSSLHPPKPLLQPLHDS